MKKKRSEEGDREIACFESQVRTRRKDGRETAKERRLPGREAPDEGTRKPKKKTSSRASVYMSVKAENAKKRNPKRATPTTDKIRAGFMYTYFFL